MRKQQTAIKLVRSVCTVFWQESASQNGNVESNERKYTIQFILLHSHFFLLVGKLLLTHTPLHICHPAYGWGWCRQAWKIPWTLKLYTPSSDRACVEFHPIHAITAHIPPTLFAVFASSAHKKWNWKLPISAFNFNGFFLRNNSATFFYKFVYLKNSGCGPCLTFMDIHRWHVQEYISRACSELLDDPMIGVVVKKCRPK